jgi:hypothetical protein
LIEEPGLTRCSHSYLSFAAKPQPNRRKIGNTMTAPGRQRKLCRLARAAGLFVLGLSLAAPMLATATAEQFVTDRYTGLAINGYDPVAYFIDRRPTPGRGDLEYAFGGAVWRFHNEGNLAAFIAAPSAYAPSLGGYDPVGVARGVALPGDPRLWHLAGDRLFLFFSPEDQAAFAGDVDRTIATADRKWLAVRQHIRD